MTTLVPEPPKAQIVSIEALNAQIKSLQSNAILLSLVQHAPEHVLLLNTQRQIVYANAAYLAMANTLELDGTYGQSLGGYLGCLNISVSSIRLNDRRNLGHPEIAQLGTDPFA